MSTIVTRCFDDLDNWIVNNTLRNISTLQDEIVRSQGLIRQFSKAQQKALHSNLINIGIAYEHLMEAYKEIK